MALVTLVAVLSNCGNSGDLASINSYDLSPNPPIVNQNMTLWIDYTLSQDVLGGTSYFTANLNGVPYSESHPLQSPILAGVHNESSVSTFPSFTGKLVTTTYWEDMYANPIWCIKAVFTN